MFSCFGAGAPGPCARMSGFDPDEEEIPERLPHLANLATVSTTPRLPNGPASRTEGNCQSKNENGSLLSPVRRQSGSTRVGAAFRRRLSRFAILSICARAPPHWIPTNASASVNRDPNVGSVLFGRRRACRASLPHSTVLQGRRQVRDRAPVSRSMRRFRSSGGLCRPAILRRTRDVRHGC